MQVAQCFSPFGLSWYFIDARMAALVEAIALPDTATTGIRASAAPPIFRNCRREGLRSSFIAGFLFERLRNHLPAHALRRHHGLFATKPTCPCESSRCSIYTTLRTSTSFFVG